MKKKKKHSCAVKKIEVLEDNDRAFSSPFLYFVFYFSLAK